jgi:hypothetical protein
MGGPRYATPTPVTAKDGSQTVYDWSTGKYVPYAGSIAEQDAKTAAAWRAAGPQHVEAAATPGELAGMNPAPSTQPKRRRPAAPGLAPGTSLLMGGG